MHDGQAQGFVLSVHVGAATIPPGATEAVVADLAHLSCVSGPSTSHGLTLHCTVSALSEGDAVSYAAQRIMTALLAAGIDAPRLLSVDAALFDDVSS